MFTSCVHSNTTLQGGRWREGCWITKKTHLSSNVSTILVQNCRLIRNIRLPPNRMTFVSGWVFYQNRRKLLKNSFKNKSNSKQQYLRVKRLFYVTVCKKEKKKTKQKQNKTKQETKQKTKQKQKQNKTKIKHSFMLLKNWCKYNIVIPLWSEHWWYGYCQYEFEISKV